MLSTRLLQSRRSRRDLRTAQSCPNLIETYLSPVLEQAVSFEDKPRRYSAPPAFYDMLSAFPEEVLLYVMSFLEISDLHSSCLVSTIWRRMCTDEFIYHTIACQKYPCLRDSPNPPFEETWKQYYRMRNEFFAVIGGPISQASCMDDICSKLRSAGLRNVDQIYAQSRIPTLAELQKYTAVLVYSYNSTAFLDGDLMGDVLADYVDNGGGVVVSVFSNCSNLRNGFVKGRFEMGQYHPITPAPQDMTDKRPLTLGRVHDTSHPIMAQVKCMDGGKSSFFCPGAVQTDARVVADWSNDVPLVVELTKGKGSVVAVNFFPPSSDVGDPRFWNATTDGNLIMANSLAFAGKSGVFRKRRTFRRSTAAPIRQDAALMPTRLRTIERSTTQAEIGATEVKKKKSLSKLLSKRTVSRWFGHRDKTERPNQEEVPPFVATPSSTF